MKQPFLLTIACLLLLLSCQSSSTSSDPDPETTAKTTDIKDKTSIDITDTIAVKVKMKEHSVKLVVRQEDLRKNELSAASVKELESWWDSLPKPIQTKIKANEVEIKLTTNVRSTNEKDISPEVTDPRIESTGAELERIIGSSTDMTFTVNTTLMDETETIEANEHSTNITLVQKIPMKLKVFSFEVPLSKEGITNENINSVQYWWTRIPEDLKEKIKKKEVIVNLSCVAIDRGMDKQHLRLGEYSEDYSLIMTDILQQMIGYHTVNNINYPFGQVNAQSFIETETAETLASRSNSDAEYIIRLSLENNKDIYHIPAL